MKSFNQVIKENTYLAEGGNVIVNDKKGNVIPAEKIDMVKFNRTTFVNDMTNAFLKLNDMFEAIYGYPIWKNKSVLTTGMAFNGSSDVMFSKQVSDEDFMKVKPKVGDIDLTVPDEMKRPLWEFLKKIQGKKITPNVTYVGNNRPNYSPSNAQINSVFEYRLGKEKVHAQVDFELTPYMNNLPSEFTKFAHSSAWNDMSAGIKGVHHKYLMRAMIGGSSIREDIVIATNTSTPEKFKQSMNKTNLVPYLLKFSVDRGVRVAYQAQFLPSGKPWMEGGKHVYKETPTSDSTYEQNLTNIYKMVFGEPQSKADIQEMWSFLGLIDLIKKHHTKKQIQATHDKLIEQYWGRGSQGFERNNPELDKQIKLAAYNLFIKAFPFVKNEAKQKKMMDEFYKNYRVTEINV